MPRHRLSTTEKGVHHDRNKRMSNLSIKWKTMLSIVAVVLAVPAAGSVPAQSGPWYGGASIDSTKSNVNAGEVNDYTR